MEGSNLPEFKDIHLFPKKHTILGMSLFSILVILTIFLINHMWGSLQNINQYHFPIIERSSINVRLINMINYQFDLLKESKEIEEDKKLIHDLNLNLQTLEQNYLQLISKTNQAPDMTVFKEGQKILQDFKESKKTAITNLKESGYLEKLDAFAFDIYDSTEGLSERRDQEIALIMKIIIYISVLALIFILFLIPLLYRIYRGYSENLGERVQAEQTAINLSRQRQSLVHILCHDLGNPLSAIYGLIKSFQYLPEEEKSQLLTTIELNTKESLDVIEVTKKMQAIESGKIELPLKPTSLEEALNRSLAILEGQIKSKDIKIDKDDFSSELVMADITCLVHSIFNNLMTNAIKFSPQGGSISLKKKRQNNRFELIITDQGKGIPSTLLPHLFSDTTATTRKGTAGETGTGLGMPLVKKFMLAFKGEIRVQSPPSNTPQGTEITLVFEFPSSSS